MEPDEMPQIIPDDGKPTGEIIEVPAPTTTHNPVQISASEEAIVTGTQVANADTGNNHTDTDVTSPGGQQPNDINTGSADAIGSDDTNVVEQEAAVTLTEQAVANLLQVALILNIGAALANSGVNDAVSTPGGNGISGAIDTGNATAVGNDMEQYITQAARAAADGNTDDAASQLAVSLWMGLANANTGINSATGTGVTGSGGAVGSGDAAAIGNQSLTDILQQAGLNGSDQSEINIEQYATVMNIGFALANSGVNDISGVASGLLTAGTSEEQNGLALDLFSMLLPALMDSFAGSSGSGTIGTGDATAIGNRSETYIHQLAEAAASGDGIATIIQDVLVANVGAAGANTGGNVLGGRYANLNPDAAKAVVTLAAFLSQMLALVHTQSASTALAMQQQGLEIPFGDIVLQVQGQMQGYDTFIDGPTGQRANIRQVTIILSLGIAQSNSGLNNAIGVNQDNSLAARVASGPGSELTQTGDALAANNGMVIICQRRNAEDIECLAPPPETVPVDEEPSTPPASLPGAETTTTVAVAGESGMVSTTTTIVLADSSTNGARPQGFTAPQVTNHNNGGTLPSTGSNVADVLLYAGALLLLGLVLAAVSTRRRQMPAPVVATSHSGADLWSLVPPEE
jgi:LPXTG-motif cell wall-anchored protein